MRAAAGPPPSWARRGCGKETLVRLQGEAAPVRIAMTMKELAWPLLMNVRPLTVAARWRAGRRPGS